MQLWSIIKKQLNIMNTLRAITGKQPGTTKKGTTRRPRTMRIWLTAITSTHRITLPKRPRRTSNITPRRARLMPSQPGRGARSASVFSFPLPTRHAIC